MVRVAMLCAVGLAVSVSGCGSSSGTSSGAAISSSASSSFSASSSTPTATPAPTATPSPTSLPVNTVVATGDGFSLTMGNATLFCSISQQGIFDIVVRATVSGVTWNLSMGGMGTGTLSFQHPVANGGNNALLSPPQNYEWDAGYTASPEPGTMTVDAHLNGSIDTPMRLGHDSNQPTPSPFPAATTIHVVGRWVCPHT